MPTTRTIDPRAGSSSLDLVLLLTLSTLWGASYTLIRVAVATIPPLTLMAVRTLIAGSLLAAWIVMRSISVPREPALWRRFLVQSLLNSVVPFTLIAWAERSVEAGLATILNSASPVLAFVATWLVTRHEQVTPRKLLGVIAGLAGICMIVGPSVFSGLGNQALPQLAIVIATICYAGAAIYGRSFQGLPPAVPAAGSLLLGAALLIPASLAKARICTYECTFCAACVENILENVCSNCGGGFVPRPIRPSKNWKGDNFLGKDPASTQVRHRLVDSEVHARFAAAIKPIPPHMR